MGPMGIPISCTPLLRSLNVISVDAAVHIAECIALLYAHTCAEVRASVFTAMQLCSRAVYRHEPDVRLSICLSVKRVNCDKTKETSAHIIYRTKDRSS